MVKKYKANGEAIKRFRESLDRQSLQKEFAAAVGMSVRKFRDIENANANITSEEADRIADRLSIKREDILFAVDHPRLVASPLATPVKSRSDPDYYRTERFDELYLRVRKDSGVLFDDASKSHVVVVHILASLTSETALYAEEIVKLLKSLSFAERDRFADIDASVEMSARRRLQELLVLLRGNDIWIYEEHHTKHLPESFEVQPRLGPDYEWQLVIALAPPAEYGEDSVKVTVDNGQPWQSDGIIRL